VDVSSAEGDAVKGRSLRQCNGCEAAVALKLGADQSFVGVVTRISRVEYAERFQIRDAHTEGGRPGSPNSAAAVSCRDLIKEAAAIVTAKVGL
jgi:hypothetical protein